MVPSIHISNSSLPRPESQNEKSLASSSLHQKAVFRSRAHNIPGGIKHLLNGPKRRRRISAVLSPSLSHSQPRLPRSMRLRHKAANPTVKQPKAKLASTSSASRSRCSQSRSQPQSSPDSSDLLHVTFPSRLPELARKPISRDVLASLGFSPEVPAQYIRDKMERLGPIMHHALRSTKASVSASMLPKTLVIDINDNGKPLPMPPTHMVAVYSSAPSDSETRRILLYPIHASILSLYCANLPVLGVSAPLLATPETPLEVPVVPLALPNPESFPVLVQFLYLKDARSLFDFFLSIVPERGIPADLAQPTRRDAFIAEYAMILSQNYAVQRLTSQAFKVYGLWQNACALGISDGEIQVFLDLAWAILMLALTFASKSASVIVS